MLQLSNTLVLGQPPSGEWGCFGIDFAEADGLAIGDGEQNIADILAGCNEVGIATKIAIYYTLNGYTDLFCRQ